MTSTGDIHFAREATGEAGERPDLAVFDQTGREIALLEIKFWAGFTDNQPLTYLSRLRGDRPTGLVFIVPDARVPSAWRHVADAIRGSGADFAELNGTSSVLRAGASANVSVLVLSWQVLLDAMQENLDPRADSIIAADLLQLRGLAERMDDDQFLPVHPVELSSGIARRQIQLADLLSRLVGDLVTAGLCERSRFDTGNSWGLFYGANITLNGVGFWIGLYYGPWRDLFETPFWMQLLVEDADRPEVVRALRPLAAVDRLMEHQGNWLIPLRIQPGVERDEVLANLISQVRSVAGLFAD